MTIIMNGAYFNGLDQSGLQTALAQIPGSVTTDYILFSLNVPSGTSADIQFGLSGPFLAQGGQAIAATENLLASVVKAGVGKGKCRRVWLSVGSANSPTFKNIQAILTAGGALRSTLLANFGAIVRMLRQIAGVEAVGLDMDYEESVGDLAAIVADVTVALYEALRCPVAFCPFQALSELHPSSSPWIEALQLVYAKLGIQPVVGFNLQIYAGGTGNDPARWTEAVASAARTGINDPAAFIWPIFSCDTTAEPNCTPAEVSRQMGAWQSKGASLWATASLPYQGFNLAGYGEAIGARFS
ncbi:MAG: hypothetical protein WCC64_03870 [Aliidongia sp.]